MIAEKKTGEVVDEAKRLEKWMPVIEALHNDADRICKHTPDGKATFILGEYVITIDKNSKKKKKKKS